MEPPGQALQPVPALVPTLPDSDPGGPVGPAGPLRLMAPLAPGVDAEQAADPWAMSGNLNGLAAELGADSDAGPPLWPARTTPAAGPACDEAAAKRQRREEAIADCTEAIRLDPDNAAAYLKRCDAKSELGRNEEAVEDFDRAVRLDPGGTPVAEGEEGGRDAAAPGTTLAAQLAGDAAQRRVDRRAETGGAAVRDRGLGIVPESSAPGAAV